MQIQIKKVTRTSSGTMSIHKGKFMKTRISTKTSVRALAAAGLAAVVGLAALPEISPWSLKNAKPKNSEKETAVVVVEAVVEEWQTEQPADQNLDIDWQFDALEGAEIVELRFKGNHFEAHIEQEGFDFPMFITGKKDQDYLVLQTADIFNQFVVPTEVFNSAKWAEALQQGQFELVHSMERFSMIRADLTSLTDRDAFIASLDSVETEMAGDAVAFPVAQPNDPGYPNAEMSLVDMEPVWEKYGFSPEAALGRRPVIAVIDGGVSLTHSDLHFWTNSGEIAGNGIDDDGNGYVDDVHGAVVFAPDGSQQPTNSHGSTVSLRAAQISNNSTGGASIASTASLMNMVYYTGSGGSQYYAVVACLYAMEEGADVVNCSWVSTSGSLLSHVANGAASYDSLVIVAAGNDRKELGSSVFLYPALYDSDFFVCVGASSTSDTTSSTNFSATNVDVFAPGSATSWAAPMASSLSALLRAVAPEATALQIKEAIIQGADPVAALSDKCVAGGRINATNSVEYLTGENLRVAPEPDPVPPLAPVLAGTVTGLNSVELTWTQEGTVDSFTVEYCTDGKSFCSLEPSGEFTAGEQSVVIEGLAEASVYFFRICSKEGAINSDWSTVLELRTPEPPPSPVLDLSPVVQATHRWSFNEGIGPFSDDCITGSYAWGLNGAEWLATEAGGFVSFGSGGYATLGDRSTTNAGIRTAYTVAFWLKPSQWSLFGNRMVFEQGGGTRGLNAYLRNGELLIGGWNFPTSESGWNGTTLSAGLLNADQWVHVAIVLDGSTTVTSDSLRVYVDGVLLASGSGSQLWSHSDDIGFGKINGGTWTDGSLSMESDLLASMDEIAIWHHALTASDLGTEITATRPGETVSNEDTVASSGNLMGSATHFWPLDEIASSAVDQNLGFAFGLGSGAWVQESQTVHGYDLNGSMIKIPNSETINTAATLSAYTLAIEFSMDVIEAEKTTVLYEQGGTLRGLNILISDGELLAGGWNFQESEWQGDWISGGMIEANRTYHVVLTLNGGATVEADSLGLYLDGVLAGTAPASQLWRHGDGIGLGGVNGGTILPETAAPLGGNMDGVIQSLAMWHGCLDQASVAELLTAEPVQSQGENPQPVNVPNPEIYFDFGSVVNGQIVDQMETTSVIGWGSSDSLRFSSIYPDLPEFGVNATPGGVIPDTKSINHQYLDTYTVCLWINPSNQALSGEAMLYEQGGAQRGLNIRLDNGAIVAEAWNAPDHEGDWASTILRGSPVEAGQWVHIALVLNASSADAASNGLQLYVDGVAVDSGEGSYIWRHLGNIGVGAVAENTAANGEATSDLMQYEGCMDDLLIFHEALSAEQISSLIQ